MIKRPIWTSGWASLCLPVGWFGVTCPFRWEPPERVARLLGSLLPGGPQVPAHSSPSAWGRACARRPAFRGRAGGLGGGRLFLLRSWALVLTIFALPLCRVHMRSLRGVISQKINVRAPHAVVRDAVVVPRGSEARRAPGARPGVFQQGSAFPSVSLALADAVGPRSSRRRPLGVLPGSIAGSFALPRPLPPLRLLCASRYLQYFTCPCLLSHVCL